MVVSENAWRRGGAVSGGSTMFALPNSRIKVSDLLSGLLVQSGNDAANCAGRRHRRQRRQLRGS